MAKRDIRVDCVDVSNFCLEDCCHFAAASLHCTDKNVYFFLPYTGDQFTKKCDTFLTCISHCLEANLGPLYDAIVISDFNINVLHEKLSSRRLIHTMSSFDLRQTITS